MKRFSTLFVWVLLITAVVVFGHGPDAVAYTPPSDLSAVLPGIAVAGLIDMFDTRTMLEAVEQIKRPSRFLRDTFFPLTHQSETKSVDVDIIKGKRRLAPFVSPLSPGKKVDGIGMTTSTITPGYIKPKKETTAEQLLKRQPGEVLYPGENSIEQRAQAKLGADLAELMDMIDRREEWMAAQALNAGTIAMKVIAEGGDQTVTVDFGMASSHKVTLSGTDLWTDTTNADPLDDLATWARLILQDSALSPGVVVMGTSVATAFMNHPKVKDKLNMLAVNIGEINPKQLPSGVSYLGRINMPSLFVDIYTYDEWYIDEDSGTETSMVPADKVWLGSTNAANTKLYAAIQDLQAIGAGMAAVSRFPKSWVTEDPSIRWVMVQSAALMALNQPDAFVSAKAV